MKQNLTFSQWMSKVDENVERKCGCSVYDLIDCCFSDWYTDGVSASSAASRAIKAEKEG